MVRVAVQSPEEDEIAFNGQVALVVLIDPENDVVHSHFCGSTSADEIQYVLSNAVASACDRWRGMGLSEDEIRKRAGVATMAGEELSRSEVATVN